MAAEKKTDYFFATPQIEAWSELCRQNSVIDPQLYRQFQVNRGLRDLNGNGVLTGLTRISDIVAFHNTPDGKQPCPGELYYRGIDIHTLVQGFINEQRSGFEETVYLLLLGVLPSEQELHSFQKQLADYRTLPTNFVRDIIMKAPSADMMNTLARSVLTLYGYDPLADDTSPDNVLRQCLQMIALFPMLAVYAYQAYSHYVLGNSLYIHHPQPGLSAAENILHLLRADSRYTQLEARVLDLALVLHAEHGGGNNSTFTTRVVTSSGTDTYSTVAAALASLKGPRHGGANIKVVQMLEDLRQCVPQPYNEQMVADYLKRLLNRQAFDETGLIYGMGHAVYSLSDPRAEIFKSFVEKLAQEKGRAEEYQLYAMVERLAPRIIAEERKIYKGVSANIDFYSGFVYKMLDLPIELYTPIFAISRIAGWSAHRMEEVLDGGKIIRPAYLAAASQQQYRPLKSR